MAPQPQHDTRTRSGHHDAIEGAPQRSPRVQLKADLRGRSYEEQLQLVRPPMPPAPVQMTSGSGPPTWRDELDAMDLADDIKEKAARITNEDDRNLFRGLTSVGDRRAFVNLPGSGMKAHYCASSGDKRWKLKVLSEVPAQFSPNQAERYRDNLLGEADNVQMAYLGLDQDERHALLQQRYWARDLKNMVAVDAGTAPATANPVGLTQWRNDRLLGLMSANPAFCSAINSAATPQDTVNALAGLCGGAMANRLLRIAEDSGFRDPAVKWTFMGALINYARTNASGVTSGDALISTAGTDAGFMRPFINQGLPATAGPPVLKAVPLTDFGHPRWGHQMKPLWVRSFYDAENATRPPTNQLTVPITGGTVDETRTEAELSGLIPKHAQSVGFDPFSAMDSSSISGPAGVGYWMYAVEDNAGLATQLQHETDLSRVTSMVGVDESPAYRDGLVIVKLTDAASQDAARTMRLTRPTPIDGIRFGQFFPEPDPSKVYGLAAGVTPEVAVGATALSSTTKIQLIYK